MEPLYIVFIIFGVVGLLANLKRLYDNGREDVLKKMLKYGDISIETYHKYID
jgi:hypothetical protein